MDSFRQFEAGPDPFGRKYQVLLKWMQTAIALRHADTIDVKFILTDEAGERMERCIALPHAELQALSKRTGHVMGDAWCCRLAMAHLLWLVESGEDLEKDLITLRPEQLEACAAQVDGWEKEQIRKRGAA